MIGGLSEAALAQDADNDGILDTADTFPCDPALGGSLFAPAEGQVGTLMFEDQWPAKGDLDFNDLVLTYNYVIETAPNGQAVRLIATYDVRALGGTLDLGLSLHLPVPASAVASVTRSVAGANATPLTPAPDTELYVKMSDNLRELFAGQAGPINSDPTTPNQVGQRLVVTVTFTSPTTLGAGAAPYDVFVVRTNNPSHEIHQSQYLGSIAMDQNLFSTLDDGSGGGRFFVDGQGLPFALHLPELADYPSELTSIDTLYPDINAFAVSGGLSNSDFYRTNVQASMRYLDNTGQPAPQPATISPLGTDRSCLVAALHGTVPFQGSATASGCSYGGAHAVSWTNLGNMDWTSCMRATSERGTMLFSSAYTVNDGWNGHRNGSYAMTSRWASYTQQPITASAPCIVGRPPGTSRDDLVPASSTVVDGETWVYQDMGQLYYEQCAVAAGNHGASIITPAVVGLGTGDDYWVNSVHMCNTYEWISGNGTSYTYANLGSNQRSPLKNCMIGYIDSSAPTTTPPPAPTPTPTPTNGVHGTVTFSGGSTAGGCSYGGAHAVQWINLGNMNWKACMQAASERSAMLFSSNYSVNDGWSSHRNGSYAMTSRWASYTQRLMSDSVPCIVGRPPGATRNDLVPASTSSFDGDTWVYEDLGQLYYDECALAAGNHGASIITPSVVGIGTGDNYWVNSVHMCNTYEWISGNGTSYTYANLGSNQRSPTKTCMIGYMQ